MSTKIDTTPYRADAKDDFYMSLTKLVGKHIKDITGYISDPYGSGEATLVLSDVIFEDGTVMSFEGSHDTVTLSQHSRNPKSAEWTLDLNDLYEDYDEE